MLSRRLTVKVFEQLRPHPHPEEQWRVPFETRMLTLGRLPYNELVLPYPTISGVHARVYQSGMQLYIEDLNSTNGTYLNGFPVARGQLVVVRACDVLRLGTLLLSLALEGRVGVSEVAGGWEPEATYEELCFGV